MFVVEFISEFYIPESVVEVEDLGMGEVMPQLVDLVLLDAENGLVEISQESFYTYKDDDSNAIQKLDLSPSLKHPILKVNLLGFPSPLVVKGTDL